MSGRVPWTGRRPPRGEGIPRRSGPAPRASLWPAGTSDSALPQQTHRLFKVQAEHVHNEINGAPAAFLSAGVSPSAVALRDGPRCWRATGSSPGA